MIISFVFILIGITFMLGTLIYTRKKNKLQDFKPIDNSNIKKGIKTLTNLWGIDLVNNQMITINKNQHSIIVELESIEYSLLHDGERANVDRELISIAQMLKFPIQFLEIKKQIELEDMLEEIKINTINANSNVKEYASQIISHLEELQKEENFFDNQPELISLLAPEVIQENKDYIYMGNDKYSRIFTLMLYPNYIGIGWLDDILNTIGNVDISTQVQVADERNVIRYLTHKVTKLQSDYLLFEKQGNIEELHRLEENIQAFEEMRREIQINNDKLFFIKITLRVNAKSLEELNENSKLLRDEFANRSCEIRP